MGRVDSSHSYHFLFVFSTHVVLRLCVAVTSMLPRVSFSHTKIKIN